MQPEDLFISMLKENISDLRSGALPKGKFIGRYSEQLNKTDKENAFRYKRPQVIGDGKEPTNNWLDFILAMPEEEYVYFKEALEN